MHDEVAEALATIKLCEDIIRIAKGRIKKARGILHDYNYASSANRQNLLDQMNSWFGDKFQIYFTIADMSAMSVHHELSHQSADITETLLEIGFRQEYVMLRGTKQRAWVRSSPMQPVHVPALCQRLVVDNGRFMSLAERAEIYGDPPPAVPAIAPSLPRQDVLTDWFGSYTGIYVTVADLNKIAGIRNWLNMKSEMADAMRGLGFVYSFMMVMQCKTRVWLRRGSQSGDAPERFIIDGDRLTSINAPLRKVQPGQQPGAIPPPPI